MSLAAEMLGAPLRVDGRVTAIGPSTTTPVPEGAEIHDYPGYRVLPGLGSAAVSSL